MHLTQFPIVTLKTKSNENFNGTVSFCLMSCILLIVSRFDNIYSQIMTLKCTILINSLVMEYCVFSNRNSDVQGIYMLTGKRCKMLILFL